jgi:phosphate transport system protein
MERDDFAHFGGGLGFINSSPYLHPLPHCARDTLLQPSSLGLGNSMSRHLQRDIDGLITELLTISSMVEEMIDQATQALSERRFDLAEEVIKNDSFVDEHEVHLEEECLKMLALHQPVAIDLRRIAAVMKINADLERIADLAVSIANRALAIGKHPAFVVPDRLPKMVVLATQMVRGSMDAFVNLDTTAARRILAMDRQVDQFNGDIIDELQTQMQKQPDMVAAALHCFSGVRHLERIADHATNIAEDVIYLVEGDIVRHRHSKLNESPS